MKMVINACYGGFGLSESAVSALGLESAYDFIDRSDPRLIALVEADAKGASGMCANLKVIELPDDITDYMLDEYDGSERVLYVQNGRIYWA